MNDSILTDPEEVKIMLNGHLNSNTLLQQTEGEQFILISFLFVKYTYSYFGLLFL